MKTRKLLAILIVIAMATMLSVVAFAEDVHTGTPDNAKLVKYLQAGTGVDLPGATFNFTITPNSGNPGTVDAVNVAIADSEMTKDANGDYIGSKTIQQIFANTTFPAAGVYTFTVDEVDPTYTEKTNETLTIDEDTFTLRVYVINGANGTTIEKVTVQNGDDEKVDPTIIKETADEGQDENGKNVGFSFTNTFKKNLVDDDQGEENQDKTGVLDITKTVVGDYGDKTFEFPFELSYTLPSANNEGAVKYKVLKKDVTNAADVVEQTATSGRIQFVLADGDKLIITQAPQGTKWATVEKLQGSGVQNESRYQASVDKYPTATAFEKGANASTSEQVLSSKDAVGYTNTIENDDVTPTGILMNNLPYIILLVVVFGGLTGYIVSKRRREQE